MDRDPDELLQHIRGQLTGASAIANLPVFTAPHECCGLAGRDCCLDVVSGAAPCVVTHCSQRDEFHYNFAGILESSQYELLESISIGQSWKDGRPLLKLWLRNPARYEA